MTKHFSRTPADLALGLVAIAPALALPGLVLVWWHKVHGLAADVPALDGSFDNSLTNWMLMGMLAFGALYFTAIVAVIRDVWIRPIPQNVRIMWTILCLLVAPYGGVVYWVVQCNSAPPQPAI